MSENQDRDERPCLHCMIMNLLEDFFAEYPAPQGEPDTIDTDEVITVGGSNGFAQSLISEEAAFVHPLARNARVKSPQMSALAPPQTVMESRDDAVAQGGIERPCFSGERGRLRVQVLPASPSQ
jgi:hypothetical protein